MGTRHVYIEVNVCVLMFGNTLCDQFVCKYLRTGNTHSAEINFLLCHSNGVHLHARIHHCWTFWSKRWCDKELVLVLMILFRRLVIELLESCITFFTVVLKKFCSLMINTTAYLHCILCPYLVWLCHWFSGRKRDCWVPIRVRFPGRTKYYGFFFCERNSQ